MPLDEVRIWIAVDRVEPLGSRRLEYYLAMIASMLHARWKPQGAPSKNLSDFVLFDALKEHRSEVDQQLIKAFTSMRHTVEPAQDE